MNVYVIPPSELLSHFAQDERIGALNPVQCLLREHHAESERVIGGIPLPDGDLVFGVELTS